VELAMSLAGVPPGPPTVALTLDACPGGFDARVAQALAELRIPATIFVTAIWLRRNPEGLAFLRDRPDLFAIANHGERHVPAVLGSGTIFGIPVAGTLDRIRREVEGGAEAVLAATGSRPGWYRTATGFYSVEAIPAIEALGVRVCGYSLAADLGASLPAPAVAARIAAARSGDIILGHINQPNRPSGAGIAAGVARLAARGARFVRLDEDVSVTQPTR